MHMQAMSHQIDARDETIEQLRWQLQQQAANYRQLFKQTMTGSTGGANKRGDGDVKLENDQNPANFGFDPDMINEQKATIDQLHKENVELRELLIELQKDIDYGKQRENKLIFFLYVLKENGLPVSDVFDAEIKDLPTTRFSKDFNDDYKILHSEIKKEREIRYAQENKQDQQQHHQQQNSGLTDNYLEIELDEELDAGNGAGGNTTPGYKLTETQNSEVEPSIFMSERLYFSS